MFGFIKKLIKLFIFFIAIFLIIWSIYRNCDSCAFWLDRQTLLNQFKIPIPKYDTVKILENDSMGYSVYLFKNVKDWENDFNPHWNNCNVTFNKDIRFDIPYKKYIHNDVSKLFLVSYNKISLVYVKEGKNIYMIVLSLGAGPANNVATKIKTLGDICKNKE